MLLCYFLHEIQNEERTNLDPEISHYRYYKALLAICQALYGYFIITLQIFYNQLFAFVDYILNLPDGIAKLFR